MNPKEMTAPPTMLSGWQQGLGIVLFLIATLYPRLATVEQYVTTDEVLWLYRSANFYYAIGQREFEETYQKFHPG
ncbi:MAG: hypothetical protein N2D54_11060, partial [Chloroflexota bacterium]